jgi:hypothetical protein
MKSGDGNGEWRYHNASKAVGALEKYTLKFHADRDHAMCNIQNHFIPVVQLTRLRTLSNTIFWGTVLSQNLTGMPSPSVQSGSITMEVPG